jgi:hypothetical protein
VPDRKNKLQTLRSVGRLAAKVGLLSGLLAGSFPSAFPQSAGPPGGKSITISAKPIAGFEINDPSRTRFGELEFRGGLVLTSSERTFGGLSALRVQEDGAHFIALSDRGLWLRGRIVYQDERPAGIADAAMAPVLVAGLEPARRWDTESLAEDGSTLCAGLEGVPNILRFDYGKEGFLARGRPITIPPELKDLPGNQGLEALVFVPEGFQQRGALIALSERGLTEAGDLKAFLIGGSTPGPFAVKRKDEYNISDAAILPGGDLLVLERKFSLESGAGMRIRRLPLGEIRPGALVDGPTIIEADMRCEIDNMEALSVHRAPSGEVRLTLLSDDNHSPLQRTLLLQFSMRGE